MPANVLLFCGLADVTLDDVVFTALSWVSKTTMVIFQKVTSICSELPTSGEVEPSCKPVWTACSVAVLESAAIYSRSIFTSALALWVTNFLEFLETRKCHRIWLRSGKRPQVREESGNLIVAAQQYNLPVPYLYYNIFHTWCSWRIRINKCAFVQHIACNFFRKSQGFFLFGEL